MRVSFETDEGAGARAALGLVVLQNDETIEGEFRRVLSGLDGVALHCSRIACAARISAESLAAMRTDLPRAASLLPSGVTAAGYACTSGATILGEDEVAGLVRRGCSAARVSNPLSAAKAALGALGVRRLAFVTPYAPEVSAAMREEFERAGMTMAGFCSFEERDDRVVARVSPESCMEAIVAAGRAEACDGVFIACTNLRALGVIERAEEVLGAPVVSSNQALAWHLLRLAGVEDELEGFGRLFECGGGRDGCFLIWSGVELPTGTDPPTRKQGNRGQKTGINIKDLFRGMLFRIWNCGRYLAGVDRSGRGFNPRPA